MWLFLSHPDSYYVELQRQIDCDAENLEAESWSVSVDQNYVKDLNKEAVKRQDVIYGTIEWEELWVPVRWK